LSTIAGYLMSWIGQFQRTEEAHHDYLAHTSIRLLGNSFTTTVFVEHEALTLRGELKRAPGPSVMWMVQPSSFGTRGCR
jgi:hypothetical protein